MLFFFAGWSGKSGIISDEVDIRDNVQVTSTY